MLGECGLWMLRIFIRDHSFDILAKKKKKHVCPKSSSDIKLKSFILILLKEEILRQPNIDSICMPVNNHSYINLKCKRASWEKLQTVQCEEKKKHQKI